MTYRTISRPSREWYGTTDMAGEEQQPYGYDLAGGWKTPILEVVEQFSRL